MGGYSVFIFISYLYFFFFNDSATTEIYTLSLHDALPISAGCVTPEHRPAWCAGPARDRKSTRLNSSHPSISYAVFCLKKKKKQNHTIKKKQKNKKTKKQKNKKKKK